MQYNVILSCWHVQIYLYELFVTAAIIRMNALLSEKRPSLRAPVRLFNSSKIVHFAIALELKKKMTKQSFVILVVTLLINYLSSAENHSSTESDQLVFAHVVSRILKF